LLNNRDYCVSESEKFPTRK